MLRPSSILPSSTVSAKGKKKKKTASKITNCRLEAWKLQAPACKPDCCWFAHRLHCQPSRLTAAHKGATGGRLGYTSVFAMKQSLSLWAPPASFPDYSHCAKFFQFYYQAPPAFVWLVFWSCACLPKRKQKTMSPTRSTHLQAGATHPISRHGKASSLQATFRYSVHKTFNCCAFHICFSAFQLDIPFSCWVVLCQFVTHSGHLEPQLKNMPLSDCL